MEFQNIDYQWLLLLIPVLIISFIIFNIKRHKDLKHLTDSSYDNKDILKYSNGLRIIKFVILILILFLSIIVLMRPKWGVNTVSITKTGYEAVFLLDVSPSMLAEDLKPNRLERGKMIIADIVEKLKGNKFAMISFSGEPTVDPPLTIDYTSFIEYYLKTASIEQIPVKGTIYKDALMLAEELFSNRLDIGRAIIIVSDGEAHDDGSVKLVEKLYKDKGIITFTIGTGTKNGTFIPDPITGKKQTKDGNIIKTSLNDELLIELATKGGGKFITANSNDINLNPIYERLKQLKKGRLGVRNMEVMKDQFQYFLIFVIMAFVILILLPEQLFKFRIIK